VNCKTILKLTRNDIVVFEFTVILEKRTLPTQPVPETTREKNITYTTST
jgi:hypothetical protein